MKRILTGIKKAPFPAGMAIISLILFVLVYYSITIKTVYPCYKAGLLFAVPFLCFLLLTFLRVKSLITAPVSNVFTAVLIPLLAIGMLIILFLLSIDAAATDTTDTSKYEKVLSLTAYPQNPLVKHFPDKIPSDAQNSFFYYTPRFLQGGEVIALRFETDLQTIEEYIKQVSGSLVWSGKMSDNTIEKYGLYTDIFSSVNYEELPEDFTVDLLYARPYRPDDWNHGKISLFAFSKQRKEAIFLAEDW